MTSWRITCCVLVSLLLLAPAAAQGAAKKRTVSSELTRLAAAGAITPTERAERASAFNAVKRAVKRLPKRSTRRYELSGVVANVEGIAARRQLTGPRLVPLWTRARAQPRLLVDERQRAEHAPHLLPRLPARLAVVPGPGPAVPPARQLRQAQPALGQPQRRHDPAARRAAGAARPARRRHRLGVLLRVRRRQAAVGLGPRAGHGHPVDHPHGAAHRPPGRGLPDRRRGARRVRDGDTRGRARGRPRTAPTTRSTPSIPGCA